MKKSSRERKNALQTTMATATTPTPAPTTSRKKARKAQQQAPPAAPAPKKPTPTADELLARLIPGGPGQLMVTMSGCISQTDKAFGAELVDLIGRLAPEAVVAVDKHDNVEVVVGGGVSRTMFTAHLDTVSHYTNVAARRVMWESYGAVMIGSSSDDVLGADCRSGCALMVYMISCGVPGTYLFFSEEESGGIGSEAFALTIEAGLYDRCVSFDRKGYTSVITHQAGGRCASDEFAADLAMRLADAGVTGYSADNGGTFTDSANFTHLIPECTNVSVGYSGAHSKTEVQDLSFLDELGKALVMIDWDSLVTVRPLSPSPYRRRASYASYGAYGSYGSGYSFDRVGAFGRSADRYSEWTYASNTKIRNLLRRALNETPDALGNLLAKRASILVDIEEMLDRGPEIRGSYYGGNDDPYGSTGHASDPYEGLPSGKTPAADDNVRNYDWATGTYWEQLRKQQADGEMTDEEMDAELDRLDAEWREQASSGEQPARLSAPGGVTRTGPDDLGFRP